MANRRCAQCGQRLNSMGVCYACEGFTVKPSPMDELELVMTAPPRKPCPTCGGTSFYWDSGSNEGGWICSTKNCTNLDDQSSSGQKQNYPAKNVCSCGAYKSSTQSLCDSCFWDKANE